MKNLFFLLSIFLFVACQSNTNQQTAEQPAKEMKSKPAIMDSFEEVNVVKMHLFGTTEAMPNADNYPYTGKVLNDDASKMLGEGLQANEQGAVYACYHTENSNHYILRTPGKNGSSDLVLALWDEAKGSLVKVMDLAYIHCEEGICMQQDAWLADLDDSRTLEMIIRKQTRDAQGNVSDESFEVLTDDGTGHFKKTTEQLASLAVKDNYVMQ